MIFGWTSLDLELLGRLDLHLENAVLSLLGILDLLQDVELQVLLRHGFFLLVALNSGLHLLRVGLGLLHGVIRQLLLLLLGLLESTSLLAGHAFFPIHSKLRGLVKFLRLFLGLLNNGADEL